MTGPSDRTVSRILTFVFLLIAVLVALRIDWLIVGTTCVAISFAIEVRDMILGWRERKDDHMSIGE